MASECREVDQFLTMLEAGEADAEDAAFAAHRGQCAACRSQWRAETELRSLFAELPRPQLAPGFDRRLRARLESSAPRPVARLRRVLLPAYWLAACLASLVILSRLEPPAGALPWLLTVAFVWLAFGPLAALARRFGLDVFDLVFLPAYD